jgi:hypothetical protein
MMKMMKQSNVRKWAFWGGVIGLVLAWNNLLRADADHCPLFERAGYVHLCVEWIEMILMPPFFAGIGVLAAWARNRIGKRPS